MHLNKRSPDGPKGEASFPSFPWSATLLSVPGYPPFGYRGGSSILPAGSTAEPVCHKKLPDEAKKGCTGLLPGSLLLSHVYCLTMTFVSFLIADGCS